ncbi:helix-turn-helix domain-containing protein [Neobacillus niacini]|uniref:helix-turn-helix domain-containing protein n=1 Tax=Neobacillus niacini TaxID=86668 RepID=UPI002FFF5F0D
MLKVGYGEFIKKHRIASGFKKQKDFADKTGISAATISRIEKEIQRPEMETLKVLAPYLESTSLVELMVKCGYWGEDELLTSGLEEIPLIEDKPTSGDTKMRGPYRVLKTKKTPPSNEEEFLKSLDLTDEELLEKYNVKIDGQPLSKDETQGIIAYIRSLRTMRS